MSENRCTLFFRHDFKNEIFYYFLPMFHEKRHVIGEKISQFNGVIIIFTNILLLKYSPLVFHLKKI